MCLAMGRSIGLPLRFVKGQANIFFCGWSLTGKGRTDTLADMTPQQAIAHFGKQWDLANSLGITQSSVAEWVQRGYIPWPRQFQIQCVTAGRLQADPVDPAPKRRVPEAA
jgi:hypothetical protein